MFGTKRDRDNRAAPGTSAPGTEPVNGQAEAYLRRLGAVPRYLRAVADRHWAGLARRPEPGDALSLSSSRCPIVRWFQ